MQTFKIMVNDEPYSVTLDEILCELMAIRFELPIDSPEAVIRIRERMQEHINCLHDKPSVIAEGVEIVCRRDIIRDIADMKVMDEMDEQQDAIDRKEGR